MSLSFDDLPTVTARFEVGQDERLNSLLCAIGRLMWGTTLCMLASAASAS